MRMIMAAVVAAGTLLGAATAASAQGVYLDGPGVSVGVGERGYRDRDYRDRDYRDRRGYNSYNRGDCRTVERQRENRDGSTSIRRTRVCD